MRFKICTFNKLSYATTVKSLVHQLRCHYRGSSVSIKYVNKSGIVGVIFVDVLADGRCMASHSNCMIDFEELDSLAAVDFEVEPRFVACSSF